MKKALITGITGQDGAYLAEFLLNISTRDRISRAANSCCIMGISPMPAA